MICLLALVVFGILGIFSASHRTIANEAFDCVFRRITLRKCNTSFDKKMKSKIMGKLLRKSPKTAKVVYKHFETISWFFTILLIVSFAYSAVGIFNWVAYGNCNGENESGFCVFNVVSGTDATISLSDIPLDEFPSFGPKDAKVQIVEFGCYQCPYTKDAEVEMEKIRETYPNDVHITFVYAPTPHHYHAVRISEAAANADKEGKYWEYHKLIFENQDNLDNSITSEAVVRKLSLLAQDIGIKNEIFKSCPASETTSDIVKKSSEYSVNLGITRTPTVYVNGEKLDHIITVDEITDIIDNENKTIKQKFVDMCNDIISSVNSIGVTTDTTC
ncbi:thioredoxin domain-containing protein [archaeon]|nr:thioredoxin domain-containing protein [archaeon]